MSENMESQLDILKTAKNNKKQKGLTREKNLAKKFRNQLFSKSTKIKISQNIINLVYLGQLS